jgi:hypothetical protein
MATLSEAMLHRAGGLARPGGRVVFAVCSVLTAECEGAIERVSDVLAPAPFDAPEVLPLLHSPSDTALRLSPGRLQARPVTLRRPRRGCAGPMPAHDELRRAVPFAVVEGPLSDRSDALHDLGSHMNIMTSGARH